MKQIITSNVRVWFYLEDRERTLESPTDKILLSLTAFADELEREKARQRVTDAMTRKAKAGHVCGGKTFGYENVEVLNGDGRRSHVERRINEAEAAVVRRIFQMCAAGTGYTRIAKALNRDAAPAPRAKAGRPSGWSPSVIKVILERRMYLGELAWNKTQKRNRWGQKLLRRRPTNEWITVPAPQLRIVADADWNAVHDRLNGVRDRLHASGVPLFTSRRRDSDSPYLLSGFARCSVCGGPLGVMSGSHSSARGHSYGCLTYHKRGSSICPNGLKLPIALVDDAVLATIGGDALNPSIVDAVIARVTELMKPVNQASEIGKRRSEIAALEQEIGRLTEGIASSSAPLPTLLEALQKRQRRRDELVRVVEMVPSAGKQWDARAVEAAVREKLATWRSLLTRQPQHGRELLREVLVGPMRFTPQGRSYQFEGEAALGRLLAGVIGDATNLVPVRGFEPRFDG